MNDLSPAQIQQIDQRIRTELGKVIVGQDKIIRLLLASLFALASFALVGCTVAPGFDFADFEMPGRAELVRLFPQHRALIERLTRA